MIIQIILMMLLMHLIADYTIQGCLANLKQRSWWIEEGKKHDMTMQEIAKYKHDYKCGLLCHSLYWTLITFSPIVFFSMCSMPTILTVVIANTAIHYWVDDMKANKRTITLCEDQFYHFVQIVTTAVAVYVLMPMIGAI